MVHCSYDKNSMGRRPGRIDRLSWFLSQHSGTRTRTLEACRGEGGGDRERVDWFYSPSCRELVFSEPGLPVYRVAENSVAGSKGFSENHSCAPDLFVLRLLLWCILALLPLRHAPPTNEEEAGPFGSPPLRLRVLG